MRDPAEFWEELLAQIEAGQVIPVIGPESSSTVTIDGREASLYRLLAEGVDEPENGEPNLTLSSNDSVRTPEFIPLL